MVKTAEGVGIAKELGGRLKAERRKQRKTQKGLAKEAGCAQQTVLDLEYGNVEHSRYLPIIAGVLGVSVHWLQTGEGRPDRPDAKAVPIGVVSWDYFTGLAKRESQPLISDWLEGSPVQHSDDTIALFADEAAAFAMQNVVVNGEWLFVDRQRFDAGLVICMMDGWHRAELRELTTIGGNWFLRVTNPALPNQLTPVSVHTQREDYIEANAAPIQNEDALPCLVLGKVIFRGVPG
jgi:DNA-binding XRE family transcriptional regulator